MRMYVDTAALERDVLPRSTFSCVSNLVAKAEYSQRGLALGVDAVQSREEIG